ncbi:MAG: hypothetical protein CMO22_02800, partial [Thiotrichales bacterium]
MFSKRKQLINTHDSSRFPKRVWITGASSGLGEALANYYVTVGSEVILTARTEDKLALICNDLNLRGVAYAYPGDVTNSEQ